MPLGEFCDALCKIGMGREETIQVFQMVDRAQMGFVSFRDLLSALTSKAHRSPPAVMLQKVCYNMVFQKCDPEETGEVSEMNFARMMAVHSVPRSAALEVFRRVDIDRTGTLSLEEASRIL